MPTGKKLATNAKNQIFESYKILSTPLTLICALLCFTKYREDTTKSKRHFLFGLLNSKDCFYFMIFVALIEI